MPSGTPTRTLTYKVLPKRDKYFGSLQYKKIAPENFAMKTSTTFREEISYIMICLKETESILRTNAVEGIRGYITRYNEDYHGTSTSTKA